LTDIRDLIRREVSPAEHEEIRELWKRHSIAEDQRDLPGLISTLTDDCVYELVQTGHRWEGHEGAARFYGELLSAFPDIHFDLTDIVIGPQGVCEEADVTGTHEADWLGFPPSGEPELEGGDLLPVGSGPSPLPRREGLYSWPSSQRTRLAASLRSKATSARRPSAARPKPERKPGEAGLRGGGLMRRGDAKHRRAARLTAIADHAPLERAG